LTPGEVQLPDGRKAWGKGFQKATVFMANGQEQKVQPAKNINKAVWLEVAGVFLIAVVAAVLVYKAAPLIEEWVKEIADGQ